MTRKSAIWYDMAFKIAILFTISAILVLGFWFHSDFYQYGLITLVGAGGLVTLIIIFITSRTLSLKPVIKPRVKGGLEFTGKAREAIVKGAKRAHILSDEYRPLPRIGSRYAASSDGEKLSTLYITDVRRTYISDLSEDELVAAGFANPQELKEYLGKKTRYPPYATVYLVKFDVESSGGVG